MNSQQPDRQINVRGEIIIEGPARLVGSFTGTIAEGRIVTSGNVSIGEEAEVHASIEPDRVAIEPGEASLTYVPAPARESLSAHQHAPPETHTQHQPHGHEQPAPQQAAPSDYAPAPERNDPEPPQVSFPRNQPQVPEARQTRQHDDAEDNAAKQARARLAAYSRKAATGTDDPSGWAAS